MAEGTVMVKDVGDSPIPEWMKTIVTQSVQDKMLSTTSAAKKVKVGNGTQRNTHLENYFTQEDWGVLRNEAQGVNMKLHLFKRVFHSIGLTNPTELTCVLANSILHVACHTGPIEEFECDFNKTFGVLQDLKSMVKTRTKRVQKGPEVYPQDPLELPADIKNKAYKHGQPVKCPLDVDTIKDLAAAMPARGSHSEVRNCKFRFSKGSQCDANLHKMFADVFMERIMNSQPSASSMPAITMLQGNGKRKRQPLALEDVVPSGPAESEAAPTDNAEPTDEPKEVEPGKSDTISVDAMALQIQNQLQANKAEKKTCAKNPQEKNNSKAAPKSSSAKSVKPKVTKKTKWTYPGTKEQEAMHLDFCTVYTCPKSFNWRVKKQGEKTDKAFSWRKEDPLKVWERVEKYLETLSK